MEPRVEDLRVEARYWRERHELYRAKAYGPRATRPGRLRELQRTAEGAEARLKRAEAAEEAAGRAGRLLRERARACSKD